MNYQYLHGDMRRSAVAEDGGGVKNAAEAAGGQQAGGGQRPLEGAAWWAAAVALVAFGGFVGVMITQTDTDEATWTRLAWLFASVEAIAFAAAGALFGSSVQRQRAEKAEERAAVNAGDAAKGKALAATLKADAEAIAFVGGSGAESFGLGDDRSGAAGGGNAGIAARHARLADELFG